MTEFGLDQSIIDKILSVLTRYPAIERAVIYGSRAAGHFKNHSDIDLAVYAPSLSDQDFAKLRFELDELPIVFKMDLVHVERLKNDKLKLKIAREEKTIFDGRRQRNN